MNHLSQQKPLVSFGTLLGSALLLLSGMLTAASTQDVPFQGMSQEQVKNVYGEPLTARAPVGKPPITRWDYDNYSVYFEGNQVVHAFLHQQRLQPQLNPAAPVQAPHQTPQASQSTVQEIEIEEIKVEEAQAKIEADMQEVEQVIETKKQKKAELAKGNTKNKKAAEAEDLNYQEAPQTDFGKWGY